MARRRADLERLLASSGAALRRLAWLLTGDADSATDLLRDALVEIYLAPGGETDAERATTAQHKLLKAYTGDDGPVGATEFGIGPQRRRDWAATVLIHGLGWSARTAAGEVGLSPGRAAEVARRGAPDAERLRDLEPPPTVGRFDADQVIAASGPARARRRARRRRVVALALVGGLLLGGVGLLGSRLNHPVGQVTSVETPDQFADVDVASGRIERLRVSVSGATIGLRFYGKPATWAHAEVTAPTGPAEVVAGEVRGMPFYVVRGEASAATVAVGRTASDVRSRAARVVAAGRWTVLWPSQRLIAETPARPLGVLWHALGRDGRAALLPPHAESKNRVALPGGGGAGGLVMSDGRVLTLMTRDGIRRKPIHDGHAVLTTGANGVPLPYTAVGYGLVDESTTPARMVPELSRTPGSSPLYVLSVPQGAWSDLPARVPVTLRHGDEVIHRITLGRAAGG